MGIYTYSTEISPALGHELDSLIICYMSQCTLGFISECHLEIFAQQQVSISYH